MYAHRYACKCTFTYAHGHTPQLGAVTFIALYMQQHMPSPHVCPHTSRYNESATSPPYYHYHDCCDRHEQCHQLWHLLVRAECTWVCFSVRLRPSSASRCAQSATCCRASVSSTVYLCACMSETVSQCWHAKVKCRRGHASAGLHLVSASVQSCGAFQVWCLPSVQHLCSV